MLIAGAADGSFHRDAYDAFMLSIYTSRVEEEESVAWHGLVCPEQRIFAPSPRFYAPPSCVRRRMNHSLRRLKLYVNVLFLCVGDHLLDALLAADTGLLVAAERRTEEMLGNFVDPDKARLHCGGGAVRGR